jgi:transglutaminase superfamily protein
MATKTKAQEQVGPAAGGAIAYYASPGAMTSVGKHAATLETLPKEVDALVRIVQGVTLHEYVAGDLYGFRIPDERKSESHIRPAQELLNRILALDPRPLSVARPVDRRLIGVCRHFAVILATVLRAKEIPARVRCGFGTYFNPGFFEDHVVCEVWEATERRWRLVDPQFDEIWRKALHIDHNVLDVPRDRFLMAADAWVLCREGTADPKKFGIFKGDLRGLWFIARNLVHDVASLNKMELLRWDDWGAMPNPVQPLSNDQLAFFDRLAALTKTPDATLDELRKHYDVDEGLQVPMVVFNAVLQRPEPLWAGTAER